MFWRQFGATGQLRTVFLTRFSFLTKSPILSKTTVAHSVLTSISTNWTVAHGVYVKLKLFNKIYQFQAKRKLRRVFWRQFRAIGQLRTVFWTSFSFLSKEAKFKQIDNCAECFDANLEQQESCARCFGQVLGFNRSRQFHAERKLRRLFWRQFKSTEQLRTLFWTSLSFLTKVANFNQTLVAQSVLTPILRYWTVALSILDKS